MRIIAIDNSIRTADDVRGLSRTASGMPISQAIRDLAPLANASGIAWALCGGLAVGAHARPRGTDDIDVVLKDESDVDEFARKTSAKFRRTRMHAMVHVGTGVEVELVSPQFVKISPLIASKAIDSAIHATVGGVQMPVVSRDGLVAMKLCRGSDYDRGDVKAIVRMGGDVDLSGWDLDAKAKALMDEIRLQLSVEKGQPEDDVVAKGEG